MKKIHWLSLIILASISGSSFIFTKTLAPILGAIGTADLRVLIAGTTLMLYSIVIKFDLEWRHHLKLYAWIGLINSGVPFFLYSFSALYLPASYLAIINSTSPLFGGIFAALWLKEKLTPLKVIGLLFGVLGVSFISYSRSSSNVSSMFVIAIAACLLAAMCYALSGILIKKHAKNIKPLALAACSQFAAGVLMLPFFFMSPPTGSITLSVALNMAALALVCSAIAYLIYFKLMVEVGPTKTLTVTFLSPFFAMLASYFFLNETITIQMLIGAVIIICATITVNRKK